MDLEAENFEQAVGFELMVVNKLLDFEPVVENRPQFARKYRIQVADCSLEVGMTAH